MTNQPTDNEWIEKARLQFRDNWKWNQTSDDFRKAIEDNLPQSISREAVEKLREKRWNGKHKPVTTENGWELVWEINNDLDQLLSPTNPQDDTN